MLVPALPSCAQTQTCARTHTHAHTHTHKHTHTHTLHEHGSLGTHWAHKCGWTSRPSTSNGFTPTLAPVRRSWQRFPRFFLKKKSNFFWRLYLRQLSSFFGLTLAP